MELIIIEIILYTGT